MANLVCTVDDDAFYAEILNNLLEMQGYEVKHFSSPKSLLDSLEKEDAHYQAMILDIMMPEMDGFTLCKEIRQHKDYSKVPVLFISSKNSMEDQIKGYEAGGDDFLSKPVQADELQVKLEHAITTSATNMELEQVVSQAQSMMKEAISSAGELDVVTQFVNACLTCNSYNSVSHALLHSCSLLGAKCSIYVSGGSEPFFDSVDGVRRTIEIELLEMAHNRDALFEFNGRLILNQPEMSLLVRRLPDDELKKERLIEQLQLLVQVASSRMAAIKKEESIHEQEVLFKQILESAEGAVDDLAAKTKNQEEAINEIIDEFMLSLREDLLDLALDKDQEVILMGMVQKNVEKITGMLMENKKSIESIRKPFHDFIEKLNTLL